MDEFEAKAIKPYLRFTIGDIVFLKSDFRRKTPLLVTAFLLDDDLFDYALRWMNSQKKMEFDTLPDKILTP